MSPELLYDPRKAYALSEQMRKRACSEAEPLPIEYILTPPQIALLSIFEQRIITRRLMAGDENSMRDTYTQPYIPCGE